MQALVHRVITILKLYAPAQRNRLVQNIKAVHKLRIGGPVQTLSRRRFIPFAAQSANLRCHLPALGVRNVRIIYQTVHQQIQFRRAEFMLVIPAVFIFQRIARQTRAPSGLHGCFCAWRLSHNPLQCARQYPPGAYDALHPCMCEAFPVLPASAFSCGAAVMFSPSVRIISCGKRGVNLPTGSFLPIRYGILFMRR